jgi:hypothetical protein
MFQRHCNDASSDKLIAVTPAHGGARSVALDKRDVWRNDAG